ncbi:DNA-processing protein DprA [Terrisporobacter glycolicus]|uniref:Smf/DprA SLOG domain-containing protein n=1 Tax=Terrisporobacter glycolicus ATCC 14880 = DSM 1288 TaxID=1121315 RepID=A0ABZ2EVR5_9FIRM|nr:DNA-processing protein DprA [Terrisporobacter glycolicus]
MLKTELILTLLNINRIGKKIINKLILNPVPSSIDALEIFNFIIKNLPNYKLKLNIQDVIMAKNKSLDIINYCEKNNIKIMTILDEDFPIKLKVIENNPVIIFYKGNKSCIIENKSVAIIGTRRPTLESEKITRNLAKIFSNKNYIIVSGLAHGIDYNAHMSTVKNYNKTVAVLPSGISNIYPSDHKLLCDKILCNNGCIISEYFPLEKPYKNHFVERDRLQSALSLGVVVVECDMNSGTMHTVNFAKKQNKIICCYKHHNMNYSCRSGNMKLLEDKNTRIIDNSYNINKIENSFIYELNDLNTKVQHSKTLNEQVLFKF